jgi:hypothetical protein
MLFENFCLWRFSLKAYFGFTSGLRSGMHFNEAAHKLLYFTLRQLKAGPDNETGYFGHRRLHPDIVSQLHLTTHNKGGQALSELERWES